MKELKQILSFRAIEASISFLQMPTACVNDINKKISIEITKEKIEKNIEINKGSYD